VNEKNIPKFRPPKRLPLFPRPLRPIILQRLIILHPSVSPSITENAAVIHRDQQYFFGASQFAGLLSPPDFEYQNSSGPDRNLTAEYTK
jgi:hypothetical protein